MLLFQMILLFLFDFLYFFANKIVKTGASNAQSEYRDTKIKINITIHFSHFKVDISITLRIRKHKNKVHSIFIWTIPNARQNGMNDITPNSSSRSPYFFLSWYNRNLPPESSTS